MAGEVEGPAETRLTGWFRLVLRHRGLVLVFVGLVSLLSLASVSRAELHSSVQKLFFGDSPEWAAYLERAASYSNDDVPVVAVRDADPLSLESLDRLDRAVALLEADPEITRVDGLHRAARIGGSDGMLTVERYAELARAAPEEREELLAQMRADPMTGGLMVSTEAPWHLLVLELEVDPQRNAESRPRLAEAVDAAFLEAGYAPEDVVQSGFAVLARELQRQTRRILFVLLPVSIGILGLTCLLLFRRLAPALVTLGVSLMAMLWTMGVAVQWDRELNLLIAVVPAVVVIVGFSDVVHLWSAYLTERRAGRDHDAAILASAAEVGQACLLTSATTFVGFVCIGMVPTPVFQQLGVLLGLGVALALLLAMTLVPIFLSMLPPPEVAAEGEGSAVRRRVDGVLDALARFTDRHPWPIIAAFGLLVAVSLVGLSGLEVDADFSERLSKGNPVRQDMDLVDRHFAGTTMLQVFVDTGTPDGVLAPETFAAVAELEARLEAHPQVDAVISLADILRAMHPVLGGEGALPTSREALAQYLLLFELSGGEELDRLVDFERQGLRMLARVPERGVRAVYEVGVDAEALARSHPIPGATVEATGFVYMLGSWLGEIVDGQRRGLALSCGLIAVMMVGGLRSLRLGLWSMVPNLVPVLALAGLLGLALETVDSDTMVVAMIALGIGVDDTIHFLVRYRLERARCADQAEALVQTFRYAGRAIFMTTVILALGFLPLAFSDYYSVWMFGVFLPLVLVVALLADLLLVPALARVGLLEGGAP